MAKKLFDNFMKDVLKAYPNAIVEEDRSGEIVIITGKEAVEINGKIYAVDRKIT